MNQLCYLTGATGFVGTHMLKNSEGFNYQDLKIQDILNLEEIHKRLLNIKKSSYIIHLAAQSHVGKSFEDPDQTFQVNLTGTKNLIQTLQLIGFKGRLLLISSGDIYGPQKDSELPITEESELRPQSPYARSKVEAETLGLAMAGDSVFDILVARSFNHIGPGQSPDFAISSFAKQLVEFKANNISEIKVGDLRPKRDFSHVRDVIRAYESILEKGENRGLYNVASGNSFSIERVLEMLESIMGVSPKRIQNPNLIRKNEFSNVLVNNEKLLSLGWTSKISIEEALGDVISFWKNQISS